MIVVCIVIEVYFVVGSILCNIIMGYIIVVEVCFVIGVYFVIIMAMLCDTITTGAYFIIGGILCNRAHIGVYFVIEAYFVMGYTLK